eukprot:5888592-Prymnesium_polylepis.1
MQANERELLHRALPPGVGTLEAWRVRRRAGSAGAKVFESTNLGSPGKPVAALSMVSVLSHGSILADASNAEMALLAK